jgi:hypothetical protein
VRKRGDIYVFYRTVYCMQQQNPHAPSPRISSSGEKSVCRRYVLHTVLREEHLRKREASAKKKPYTENSERIVHTGRYENDSAGEGIV